MLTVIATDPGSSAAEIARITGLGPQTVARNVAELEAAGLVARGAVRRGMRGQPATELFLADQGAFSIGCEIGFRHIEATLRSLGGRTMATLRVKAPRPPAGFLEALKTLLARLLEMLGDRRDRLVGIGLAVPADFAALAATLAPGHPVPPLDVERVRLELNRQFDVPVTVYNDGSAACWAELARQSAPRPANFLYVMLGDHVSSGLIAEGRLWEGPTGASSNLGTMLVRRSDGSTGFVHDIASLGALCSALNQRSCPLPRCPAQWDWPSLGSPAEIWLDEAAAALAQALANAAAVIEIRRVILDTPLPRLVLDRLLARLRCHTARLPHLGPRQLNLLAGSIGEGAAAYGAALLPIYRTLFSAELEHLELSRFDNTG